MSNSLRFLPDNNIRNIGILIIVAMIFHGALTPFTIESTYDAYIHMFFGDHYVRSWFDPWEPRWYTGFSVTSYPPATHMIQALLRSIFSIKVAYVITMLIGVITLVVGYYRFVRIWMPRAAFLSTLLLIFASSIAETIHIFGQLPTIFSLGIFLNAMPHVYRWLLEGSWKDLLAAVILSGAATSAHHVTTIFGSVFFIGPLAAYAWFTYLGAHHPFANGLKPRALIKTSIPVVRGVVLAVLILTTVIITVFPYWYWSFTDPINQVPIPHGTRENFLVRRDLGMVFFIIPWGVTLFFLPYIFYRGLTTKIWPFAASLLLCFVLGTGGTTPIPKFILRGAFDILTLDRFTFWGSLLAIPFVAYTIERLMHGPLGDLLAQKRGENARLLFVALIFFGYTASSVAIGTMSAFKRLQPDPIDPIPIVQFMESDEHFRWRYLTLGFGDQFAYVSAQTFAMSVDGNYHSARRLPDLTNRSVERLENAKYLGVGGIGSLQQFLFNANEYYLKYIFSNDSFYDPLLYASGWNAIVRLPNNIVVWEKPNIDPLPFNIPRKNFPKSHRLMWGVLPITMCFLGYILIISAALREATSNRPVGQTKRPYVIQNLALDLKILVTSLIVMVVIVLGGFTLNWVTSQETASEPDQIVALFLKRLNMRHFEDAFEMLDPETRGEFSSFHFAQMWDGGLINSYGELTKVEAKLIHEHEHWQDFEVNSEWLTALGVQKRTEDYRTIERDGEWYIVPQKLPPHQTTERVMSRTTHQFHNVGRRQPLPDTDLYKDMPDRPTFSVRDVRMVNYHGRFSLIGLIASQDADPMSVSLKGELYDQDKLSLIKSGGGVVTPFNLLPAESGGFRVDFQGRLSIQDAAKYDGFNPEIYVPPVYEREPIAARLGVSSVINSYGDYRSVMLSEIESEETADGLVVTGRAINNGIEILTTAKVITTLYGQDGKPIWVDANFVNSVLRPGQSTFFEFRFPKAEEIDVVYELVDKDFDLNMNLKNDGETAPDAALGTLPLNGKAGYQSMRIYMDPQVYEGIF